MSSRKATDPGKEDAAQTAIPVKDCCREEHSTPEMPRFSLDRYEM